MSVSNISNPAWVIMMIAVAAAITFFLRCLPFLIFSGERTMPHWLNSLGEKLPAAIMAVLVIYCLKDCGDDWLGIGILKLIAVAVVAISYKWKHSTFLSILLGTACYMVLLRV